MLSSNSLAADGISPCQMLPIPSNLRARPIPTGSSSRRPIDRLFSSWSRASVYSARKWASSPAPERRGKAPAYSPSRASSRCASSASGNEPAAKPKKPRARKQANPAPAAEAGDERSMGEIFQQEPTVQKVLDMFDGEVLE